MLLHTKEATRSSNISFCHLLSLYRFLFSVYIFIYKIFYYFIMLYFFILCGIYVYFIIQNFHIIFIFIIQSFVTISSYMDVDRLLTDNLKTPFCFILRVFFLSLYSLYINPNILCQIKTISLRICLQCFEIYYKFIMKKLLGIDKSNGNNILKSFIQFKTHDFSASGTLSKDSGRA